MVKVKSNSMDKLLIIGGGGHSTVVIDTALATKKFTKISFVDDDEDRVFEKKLNFAEYLGNCENALKPYIVNDYKNVFIALGNNQSRYYWYQKLLNLQYEFPTLLHPRAIVSEFSTVEMGSIILANAVIQANTKIGKFSIINTSANVDHDCNIGDFSHMAPGVNIAGGVSIGKNCFVGTGASLIPNINVGCNVIVGAGSTVLNDLKDGITAFGNPAKKK